MAWLGSSCVALLGLCAGCVSGDVTDLVPEGPPMIRQLILTERYPSGSASLTRPVIAFGTHRDASSDEQHVVSAALVENQRLRVVMDELLLGNRLEELQCNEQVDEDAFARVPAGATPDDLARCSGDPEALRATCKGAKAVCVRSSDGVAVGILDRLDTNGQPRPDGVPDVVRFIDGAALVRCTAAAVDRDVPASQSLSYWQPAGSQVRHDIDDGFRGFLLLGPAVVLVPRHALPTGSACHVRFAEDVVDKSGLRPCAPAAGDVTATCAPGDTDLASFTTEPLAILQRSLPEGAVGVPRLVEITLRASAPLAAPQVTISPSASLAVTVAPQSPSTMTLRPTSPLSPNTRYVVSVELRDSYGLGPVAPLQLTFTTGGMLTSASP